MKHKGYYKALLNARYGLADQRETALFIVDMAQEVYRNADKAIAIIDNILTELKPLPQCAPNIEETKDGYEK